MPQARGGGSDAPYEWRALIAQAYVRARIRVLEAEEATQAVSVAGDRLIPMLDRAHGERKATNQGERYEQGQCRCNAQAGCAAANPIAITAPDVKAGSQLFSTRCVGQD